MAQVQIQDGSPAFEIGLFQHGIGAEHHRSTWTRLDINAALDVARDIWVRALAGGPLPKFDA
jgi:hypothetical protein